MLPTVLLCTALAISACKRTSEQKAAPSAAPAASSGVTPVASTVVRITAFQDGRLLLDGAAMSAEQLLRALGGMDPTQTTIWYYREAPREPPHPAVAGIVQAIAALGFPVSLSTQADFSDFVGLDKQARPRPAAP
jgi:hypothetical protein